MINLLKTYKIILNNGKINPHASKIVERVGLISEIINYTNFLPIDATLTERLYYIKHNKNESLLCKTCGNIVRLNLKNNLMPEFCSRTCVANNSQIKERKSNSTKITNIIKFGVDNPFKSNIIKDKIKQTIRQKYNVDNASRSDSVKEKKRITVMERYKTTSPLLHPDVIQKTKTTNLLKYGHEHHSSSDQIKEKVKHTFNQRYNCNQNQLHLSSNTIKTLNDFNLLKQLHVERKFSLSEIADMLGVSVGTLVTTFEKHNEPIKHFNQSSYERKIIHDLRSFNIEIEENNRVLIRPYELDIVLPSIKIAIEICGLYWHSDQHVEPLYHYKKCKLTNDIGYKLLTIFEDEVLFNYNYILQTILSNCNLLPIIDKKTITISKCFNRTSAYCNDVEIAFLEYIDSETITIVDYMIYNNDIDLLSVLLASLIDEFNNCQLNVIIDKTTKDERLFIDLGFNVIETFEPQFKFVYGNKRYTESQLDSFYMNPNRIYKIYDCGKLLLTKKYS